MGGLNDDIVRDNADILSTTQRVWGKVNETVSWVNTFPLFLLYRLILFHKSQSIEWSVCKWMRQHRGFPRTWCYLAGTAFFKEISEFSNGSQCPWDIYVSNITCFYLVYCDPTQLLSTCSRNWILGVDEQNTENGRSGYRHHCGILGYFRMDFWGSTRILSFITDGYIGPCIYRPFVFRFSISS